MPDPLVDLSRRMIAEGSRSFAAASRLLPRSVRESAWMLYAWCRYCDDRIDVQDLGRGAPEALPDPDRLDELREHTGRALQRDGKADEPVFLALRTVVERHGIPHRHPMELIDGFAMDVAGRRFSDLDDTLSYAYHVAGVVGVMMAYVMDVKDPETIDRASDLGIALQLTNIARDVMDDAEAGRIYLPVRWLSEAGVPEDGLRDHRHRVAVVSVVRRLLGVADRYYESGGHGIRALDPRSAWSIATARNVYRDIGRVVLARGPRAWDCRAVVSAPRKALLMAVGGLQAAAATTLGRATPLPPRGDLWTRRNRTG